MKTTIKLITGAGLFLFVATLFLSTASCQRTKHADNDKPGTKGSIPDELLVDTVPLDQAIADIKRYKDFADTAFTRSGLSVLRAFTMNTFDLLDALNLKKITTDSMHVRGYLAINKDNEFRLYLVRVTDATLKPDPHDCVPGKDVFFEYEGRKYVLDLNAPCPKTCDIESPLYKLGND